MLYNKAKMKIGAHRQWRGVPLCIWITIMSALPQSTPIPTTTITATRGRSIAPGADCSACGGCPHTPMEELMALMKYMVGHNAAHAQELAGLARQLEEAGAHSSYEQVMQAVSDFEKGNLRLSTVLTALEHERNG